RPQVVSAAQGADPRHLDGFDAEVAKLRDVRRPEVEHRRAVGTLAKVGALAARDHELRASAVDRVAARADRWADRRHDPGRARPSAHERADERLRDAEARPLPSGVRCADATGRRVDEEDRDAISGGDAEQHAGSVGPQRIAFEPRLDRAVEADDGVSVDLTDSGDRVEAECAGEPLAIPLLVVEREHRPGHAALGARGESRHDVIALEQRRAQKAVALDPRRGDDAHPVGVANARIAATIPASAPMSQKRMVTFTSGHSNWLCSGAMRKMRLPRSLKLPT